jgi:hypothetical protein
MREITKKYWLILQTHNPTLQMSYLSMDIKVRRALEISFLSILVSNFSPTLIYNTYLFKAGTIWINLCYSVLASVLFFYFNEHLQKFTKRTRAYSFETRKLDVLVKEITGYMETAQVSQEHIDSETIDKINLYDYSTRHNLDGPVHNPEGRQVIFDSWRYYSIDKTIKIRGAVNDFLNYHESLDPSLVECLRELQEKSDRIDITPKQPGEISTLTYDVLALHDQLAMLRPIIYNVYKSIKPVNDFREMIKEELNNNSYPGEYKRDGYRTPKEINYNFVRNLVVTCICIGLLIALTFFS